MSDSPELRTDPITGNRVIIATNRGLRPGAFQIAESAWPNASLCPFCPGNEDQTPPSVLTYPTTEKSGDEKSGDEGGRPPDWSLRVVPNLFPATIPSSPIESKTSGWYESQPNIGHHEVVIETNRHTSQFSEIAANDAEQVFLAYAQRFRAWQTDAKIRFGFVFKNSGRAAGASIEHVHSQLVGLSVLPTSFVREFDGARSFFDRQRKCVFCEMLEKELIAESRIVDADDDFVVLCPFASRVPYEMWIIPRSHASHFDREREALIKAAGRKTQAMLTRLAHLIENVSYNYLIHTAPFDMLPAPHYDWHVEVIPRMTGIAGFEWGTGCHINPVSPEQAALQLRSV